MPLDRNTASTLVKVLAVIYMVFGAMGILGGILVLAGSQAMRAFVPFSFPGEFAALFTVLAVITIILSVFEVIVGAAMFSFQPWSRVVGAVLGIIGILSFPVGTLIGAGAIWLLLVDPMAKSLFEPGGQTTAPPL